MNDKIVGKIRNVTYNTEDGTLEVTIKVFDKKFQKELLRNFQLSGKLKIKNELLIFDEEEDAKL